MGPESWTKIVKIIAIITIPTMDLLFLHGTDTMSFTASALSFMLEKPEQTGNPDRLSASDRHVAYGWKKNLITAIEIAAAKENGQPIVPEVCIFFENDLMRGNQTQQNKCGSFQCLPVL